MQAVGLKKLFDKLGFGWIISSQEKVRKVALSDINPIHLWGNFDSGFALGEYSLKRSVERKKTKVGELLHKFKYEQDRHAGEILADLASDFINSHTLLKSSDLILTVPPSFKSRSFDPVPFLTERIEERTQIRWEKDALRRTRITKLQKEIRQKEVKRLNVLNTFKLEKPLKLEGKKILLIDDIFDSGATLNEISTLLIQAKADKINVFVLARTQFSER